MIAELGESRVKTILSSFSCPLNKDVEKFLKQDAIEFAKQRLASTHLVFTSYKGQVVLVGYFAIAYKVLTVKKSSLSNSLCKRIRKFATYSDNSYILPSPLIGQLGKNYTNKYNELITGDELLYYAIEEVKKLQMIASGKVVYLECADNEKLISFYSRNGFVNFGKRKLEGDEVDLYSETHLVQMLRYIS